MGFIDHSVAHFLMLEGQASLTEHANIIAAWPLSSMSVGSLTLHSLYQALAVAVLPRGRGSTPVTAIGGDATSLTFCQQGQC